MESMANRNESNDRIPIYTDHGAKKLLGSLVIEENRMALAFVKNDTILGYIFLDDVFGRGYAELGHKR